jgi:ABC-type tungstate transport system substrate-binding protein
MSQGKLAGWKAVVHFATHATLGMAIFAIVAIPAVLLNLFIHWLEAKDYASPFVIFVLTFVEYAVLVADAALYLYLVGKSLYKASEDLEL